MDDYKLKQILKQQADSFDEDIDRKMDYLQSDAFFDHNFYQYDFLNQTNDEITLAFEDSQGNDMVDAFSSQSEDDHFWDERKPVKRDSHFEQEPDYRDREQSIAERIASLRGTSLPGGYLRNYKF